MTEIAASDFRHPLRYVRLDTILRLRWLAALGQLTAIFIVAHGLEFDVAIIPCVAIVGLSALAQSRTADRVQSDAAAGPVYAAALLALNIVELAALLFLTGGLQNPFSFLFLAPVLISATALPIRLTIALGVLAVACASALVFFHLPLPWDSDDPLVLPPIYLFGVWLSILVAIGVTCLYTFQVTEEARQTVRRTGGDRTGADPRAASHPDRRPCCRCRPRTRHAAVDDLPDFARARKDR